MQTFSPFYFLLEIASAAALLIWAVRLVRTGFERALGGQLRVVLRRSTKNRISAAATGCITAMLLQSSTAVAVLASGFMVSGAFGTAPGLAMLLGADLGSALVAQVLVARSAIVTPILLLLGVSFFLLSNSKRLRQAGRILIGLGLIFVSLDMIRTASAPLAQNETAQLVMVYLSTDLVVAFCLAAFFAWAVHSSLAAVLLWVTLAAEGILPVPAAMAMVMGANLGGSIIAFVLTLTAPAAPRRMVLGNLVLRGGGAALMLIPLSSAGLSFVWLGATPAQQVLNLHLAFNAGLLCLGLPLVGFVAQLASYVVNDPAPSTDPSLTNISALDPAALKTPARAFACATRELVRIGETVEVILRDIMALFDHYDDAKAVYVKNGLSSAQTRLLELKLYLAQLNQSNISQMQSVKCMDMSTSGINLEAAAALVAHQMLRYAKLMNTNNLRFSEQGRLELREFHDHVLSNVQLGIEVLITQDPASARSLVEQKVKVREAEQQFQHLHLQRLQAGAIETIETSSIHLDTLRALKLINTSFAMIAYPILEQNGELLDSRLTTP
ncbi:MAG: phosphate:Na+ symporter [Yoonia sp.]